MILSNGIITLEVAGHGAEPVSLVKDGREYMWTGDPAFWNRHAPILFPAVGKPCNNEVRIDGKVFNIKQHGFARDREFVEAGDGLLKMLPEPRPDNYPYRFALEAQYRLNGSSVEIVWTIENLDYCDMYAQIGAHPGFLMPDYNPADDVHGFVRYYDAEGRPVSPLMVSGLDDGNRVPLPSPVRIPAVMPILSKTFDRDALIFENGQVATTELCDKNGAPVLRVECPQAEAYGIWAPHKPDCPFVCLEPWCGICDRKGYAGDISGRDCIHRIAPSARYQFKYVITVF